jgi:hypothetical protein
MIETQEKRKMRKGQVTIFILIAIVIFAVLLIIFYPNLKAFVTPTVPVGYIEECISEDLDKAVDRLMMQGGSLNPKLHFAYAGNKIEYLCYTNEYFVPCVVQQPLLIDHIERELKGYIESRARSCLSSMVDEMKSRGYSVSSQYRGTDVELAAGNVNVIINAKVILTKDGTQTFNKFEIKKPSSLYDLAAVATSIVKVETKYGDMETLAYMAAYRILEVERLRQGDGSTVYILRDINTGDEFMFAVRSLAYPGGRKFRL